VLILHTHATESYTKSGETYQETARWRTRDENYNMLSIGDALGRVLAREGITAVHDRQIHDYPSYNGSYNHARSAISEYLAQYPTIRLVLDLHRDAADTEDGQLRPLVTLEGTSTARLMLVLGTGDGGLSHPHWEDNLSLAVKLHTQLERQAPGITRPLLLRSQRFNQDLHPGALLVEVGAAGNTHSEALAAAEQLGLAIAALARGCG
jgi:stage II sporulation protein P